MRIMSDAVESTAIDMSFTGLLEHACPETLVIMLAYGTDSVTH
jgi:hypothetical protein